MTGTEAVALITARLVRGIYPYPEDVAGEFNVSERTAQRWCKIARHAVVEAQKREWDD